MNWIEDKSYNVRRRKFHAEVDGTTVILIDCWRDVVANKVWYIEIHAWNIPSYHFEWRKRFHKKDVLAKVEDVIRNAGGAKLVIFNRIFEGINEI